MSNISDFTFETEPRGDSVTVKVEGTNVGVDVGDHAKIVKVGPNEYGTIKVPQRNPLEGLDVSLATEYWSFMSNALVLSRFKKNQPNVLIEIDVSEYIGKYFIMHDDILPPYLRDRHILGVLSDPEKVRMDAWYKPGEEYTIIHLDALGPTAAAVIARYCTEAEADSINDDFAEFISALRLHNPKAFLTYP
jgi:hypothetical protein